MCKVAGQNRGLSGECISAQQRPSLCGQAGQGQCALRTCVTMPSRLPALPPPPVSALRG